MVLSCHALTNGRLHQSRQGREHVDGGVDLGGQKVWQKAWSKLSFPPPHPPNPRPACLRSQSHPQGARGLVLIHPVEKVGHYLPDLFLKHSRAWVCRCLCV